MEHTKGPWRLGADGRRIWALKEKLVAEVPGWGIYQGKVDKANAELIVRAPEMEERLFDLGRVLCQRDCRIMELEKELEKLTSPDGDVGRWYSATVTEAIAKERADLKAINEQRIGELEEDLQSRKDAAMEMGRLAKRIIDLEAINEQHQVLNGQLQVQVRELRAACQLASSRLERLKNMTQYGSPEASDNEAAQMVIEAAIKKAEKAK